MCPCDTFSHFLRTFPWHFHYNFPATGIVCVWHFPCHLQLPLLGNFIQTSRHTHLPTLHYNTLHAYKHTYIHTEKYTYIHLLVSMPYPSRHTFDHSGCQATAMQEIRFRLTCCQMKSKLPILLCELNLFKKYKLHQWRCWPFYRYATVVLFCARLTSESAPEIPHKTFEKYVCVLVYMYGCITCNAIKEFTAKEILFLLHFDVFLIRYQILYELVVFDLPLLCSLILYSSSVKEIIFKGGHVWTTRDRYQRKRGDVFYQVDIYLLFLPFSSLSISDTVSDRSS